MVGQMVVWEAVVVVSELIIRHMEHLSESRGILLWKVVPDK